MTYDPSWNLIKQPVTPGSLQGSYPNIDLADTGVAPGSYGDSTTVPVITVDEKGRISNISTESIAFPPSNAQPPSVAVYDLSSTSSLALSDDIVILEAHESSVSLATQFSVVFDSILTVRPKVYHIMYRYVQSAVPSNVVLPIPLRMVFPQEVRGWPLADSNMLDGHSIVMWPNTRMTVYIDENGFVYMIGGSFETPWYDIPSSSVADWYTIVRTSDYQPVSPATWNLRSVQWRARASSLDVRYRFQWSGGAVQDTQAANEFYVWLLPSEMSSWTSVSPKTEFVLNAQAVPLYITHNEAPAGHLQNAVWVTTGMGNGGHGVLFPHLAALTISSVVRHGLVLSHAVYHATDGWLRMHAYGTRLNSAPCPLGVHDDVTGSFMVSIPFEVV